MGPSGREKEVEAAAGWTTHVGGKKERAGEKEKWYWAERKGNSPKEKDFGRKENSEKKNISEF